MGAILDCIAKPLVETVTKIAKQIGIGKKTQKVEPVYREGMITDFYCEIRDVS